MEVHPSLLYGPWDEGWALDKHTFSSICIGEDPFGRPQFDTTRTELGEILYRLKYNQRTCYTNEIAVAAVEFLRQKPWFSSVDLILPAPPSKEREVQPTFLIAKAIADMCQKFYADDALQKIGQTEAKNLSGIEKQQLAGSVVFVRQLKRPCNTLVIDDLYSSGATLSACVQALKKDPNASKVYVLAITQTRTR